MVFYDSKRIAAVAEEVAAAVGLADDVDVTIEVDEASPFGHTVTDVDGSAVRIRAESAAFEDARSPRNMSEEGTRQVLGRLLFRVSDRLSSVFGNPPTDADLTYEQHSAWDAYAIGRVARLGYFAQKDRRRYHFRLRHGFTDVADQVFDRLWSSENLTWADLLASCEETAAAKPARDKKRPPAPAKAKPKTKARG